MNTRITVDQRPVQDGHAVRVLLSLTGSTPDRGARTPLNLSLVLDRSGSMAGEKLHAARDAARQLVRRLWPEDVVSVVAYDDEVTTICEPVSGAGAADVSARIAAIESGGSTNLSGGWLRGRAFVAAGPADARIRRVLLLTDGQANVGIQDSTTLAALCAGAREGGITTTTIGFGADYDEHLLRAMAEGGGGAMYYIESPEQAAAIFNEELNDLLATTAQNVTVTIEPAAGVALAVVHHSYPRQVTGTTLRLDIGDLYAREPRLLLAEFVVVGAPGADSVDVATLTVRGDVISDGAVHAATYTLPVTITRAGAAVIDPEIERELLITAAAAAREEALRQRRDGNTEGAVLTLRASAARVRDSAHDDEQLLEEALDLASAADLFEAPEGSFSKVAEEKYHFQRAFESGRGRSRRSSLISRKPRPDA
jgi:Ca-activated chloride channel homolog